MTDRLTDPVAFGKRIGLHLEPLTRFPSERMKGVALARNNGRVTRECGEPMLRTNPYRKGSRNHAAFIDGYAWADERMPAPAALPVDIGEEGR